VEGGFGAFSDNFEDLHGITQLPGIAAQRLMADGYGFGAEGDWKSEALLRILKVMAEGLPEAPRFMEDIYLRFFRNSEGTRSTYARGLSVDCLRQTNT